MFTLCTMVLCLSLGARVAQSVRAIDSEEVISAQPTTTNAQPSEHRTGIGAHSPNTHTPCVCVA